MTWIFRVTPRIILTDLTWVLRWMLLHDCTTVIWLTKLASCNDICLKQHHADHPCFIYIEVDTRAHDYKPCMGTACMSCMHHYMVYVPSIRSINLHNTNEINGGSSIRHLHASQSLMVLHVSILLPCFRTWWTTRGLTYNYAQLLLRICQLLT